MDAGGTAALGRRCSTAAALRACATGVLLASGTLLAGSALLLPLRRLAGGLSTPLSPLGMMLVVVMLVAVATAFRWATDATGVAVGDRRRLQFWLSRLAPGVAMVLVGWAVSLPGSSWYGLSLMWFVIVAVVGLSVVVRGPVGQKRTAIAGQLAAKPSIRFDPPEVSEPHVLPAELSQRMDRGRGDDNHDVCHGHVRSSFQDGQRTDTIHLAFCPPFLNTPNLHVEQVDGPDVQIKATQILPYGARVELRLVKAGKQPAQTVIEFSAIG